MFANSGRKTSSVAIFFPAATAPSQDARTIAIAETCPLIWCRQVRASWDQVTRSGVGPNPVGPGRTILHLGPDLVRELLLEESASDIRWVAGRGYPDSEPDVRFLGVGRALGVWLGRKVDRRDLENAGFVFEPILHHRQRGAVGTRLGAAP